MKWFKGKFGVWTNGTHAVWKTANPSALRVWYVSPVVPGGLNGGFFTLKAAKAAVKAAVGREGLPA